MVEAMRQRADLVRAEAERIASVRTGAYAFGAPGRPGVSGGGFKVTAGIGDGVAYGRVSNDVRNKSFVYSFALEFGTKYMRKQRTLGRALDVLNRP
jgi:hypothetical protein